LIVEPLNSSLHFVITSFVLFSKLILKSTRRLEIKKIAPLD